jgi:beta-lactamase superfamily II metal-dependent hydrolase
MSATKRGTRKVTAASPSVSTGTTGTAGTLSVRMYDVGFGDCFLLTIPTSDGIRRVLFDCGSLKGGSLPLKKVPEMVIEDCRDADGSPRIDVVVGTHRHKDHVSGFDHPGWAGVRVQEVWMPWTEDPGDDEGKRIRDIQSKLALQLTSQLQAALQGAAGADASRLQARLTLALIALTNEGAMRTLHHGFVGSPVRRFLPVKDARLTWFATPVLPGVTIHVLGPSRDPDVIRNMDPPSGQAYLKLLASLGGGATGDAGVFSADWRLSQTDYATEFQELAASLSEKDRTTVGEVGFGFDEAVAAALDQAVNGTSLMLVFQIGTATLLFPGDAQWGTWDKVLDNQDFRNLLGKTTFYKVGHHGSHNATPVEFVEKVVGPDFWAMVSTNQVDQWPHVPKPELLAAMGKRTGKLVRSDQLQNAPSVFTPIREGVIEAHVPF